MDYLASNIMLPAGGIFIALYAGWVAFPKIMDGAEGGIGDVFAGPGFGRPSAAMWRRWPFPWS